MRRVPFLFDGDHQSGTPERIQSFSQNLYNYISHLQVALSGFIIALGVAVIAVGIALPLHFPYGIATLGHLGLIYLDAAILLVDLDRYEEIATVKVLCPEYVEYIHLARQDGQWQIVNVLYTGNRENG